MHLKKPLVHLRHVHITLPVPSLDHSSDYERAIAMLEWEVEDKIVLEQYEFAQLVLDDWQWKSAVVMSNNFYTASASPSKARR